MRRYLSSRCDASTDRLRPTSYLIAIQNIGRLKSFVDDLDMEWGIVRMRVGLSYDLLRFSLLFRDLSGFRFSRRGSLVPPKPRDPNLRPPLQHTHTHNTTTPIPPAPKPRRQQPPRISDRIPPVPAPSCVITRDAAGQEGCGRLLLVRKNEVRSGT